MESMPISDIFGHFNLQIALEKAGKPSKAFLWPIFHSHYFPGACLVALAALRSIFGYMVFRLYGPFFLDKTVGHVSGTQCISNTLAL